LDPRFAGSNLAEDRTVFNIPGSHTFTDLHKEIENVST
jgi:hypothetical protein